MDSGILWTALLAFVPVVLAHRMTKAPVWHRLADCVCLLIILLIVLNVPVVRALLSSMHRPVAAFLVALIFALVGLGAFLLTGERKRHDESVELDAGIPALKGGPEPAPAKDTTAAKPLVAVMEEGPYVIVRNTGAPATFRARLMVTHAQEFPSVSAGSHFEGIWETTLTDKTEIATGDEDRVMLGAVSGDHDPNVTPFHFYDVATSKMGVREARQLPDHPAPVLSIDLTLVSVPAMAGGPKTYELSIWPGGTLYFLREKSD